MEFAAQTYMQRMMESKFRGRLKSPALKRVLAYLRLGHVLPEDIHVTHFPRFIRYPRYVVKGHSAKKKYRVFYKPDFFY